MTWKSFHSRGEVLRTVVDIADLRRDGVLPMDVDGVAETFGDEHTLLGALTLRWHTRLAGRIERELVGQPMDLTAAVVAAWRGTADENPGIHAIIDRCTAQPSDGRMAAMLATSATKSQVLLAITAGLSSLPPTEATLRIGAELEQLARTDFVPAAAEADLSVSFLHRLRSAFAA